MKTSISLFVALILLISCNHQTGTGSGKSGNAVSIELSPGKNRITFESEGETLVGDLYLPRIYKNGDKLPGIIVGGSWTTVKEQMAGLYAEKLAEKGFVALAFDHRFYGESGGEPRYVENPEAKTEDFINAVRYLKSLPVISFEKIGGMAICASGGYMAQAVAKDQSFKSFATVVPWFNTEEVVNAFYGGEVGINERIDKSRNAQKKFEEEGVMTYIPTISDTDTSAAMYGPFGYYLNPELGKVPNWSHDKFALTNWEPWLTYRPLGAAQKIDVPVLIINSKGAATPAANEVFYQNLAGEKEMVWLEGGQLDFYYQPKQVDQSVELVTQHFMKSF